MTRRDPIGHRGSESPEDGVNDRHGYRHPESERRRAHRTHHPARRVYDVQRAEAAVVDRIVGRRGEALVGDLAGAIAGGGAGIVETAHLLRNVRQVDRHPVFPDRYLDPDRDALADIDAVVVHVGLGLVNALGHGPGARPRRSLRLVHDRVDRGQHLVAAVAVQQLGEATLAGPHGGQLGPKIAHRPVGQMDVHLDDVDQVLVDLPAPLQLEQRNLQPLGVDVRGHSAEHTADVEPVRHADRKRGQLSAVEDRQAEGDVVEVAAGDVAVIGYQDVARLDVIAEMGELGLQCLGHAADEHREAETDGDRLSALGEQPGGEVERLVDDHVVGRAHEVGLHLLGHRDDPIADNFGGDGIGAGRLSDCHRGRLQVGALCNSGNVS